MEGLNYGLRAIDISLAVFPCSIMIHVDQSDCVRVALGTLNPTRVAVAT